MLIKEYRIPLPLSIEEYRIAQLYMIQKKSRLESKDRGSGVEILINEPYTNGPGGKGQYTKKVYHIGSHLPGWLKSLLPKSALCVEEEAWNAYPYTKTKTTCPFIEKFYVDVETYYCADDGSQENIFGFSRSERTSISIDVIDPIKDPFPHASYKKEEDPKFFVSKKTNRGPVNEDWLQQHRTSKSNSPIMCAYKLIKVEFKYWGMQSKIEHFIHDSLRNPILVGHRQAWSWQDEWYGLTMADIRRLEEETQRELAQKLGGEKQDHKQLSVTTQSYLPGSGSASPVPSSHELLLEMRMNAIEQRESGSDTLSDEEDEFVDALEWFEDDEGHTSQDENSKKEYEFQMLDLGPSHHAELHPNGDPTQPVLLLVIFGGSVLDMDKEPDVKMKDFKTLELVFKQICNLLYPDTREVTMRFVNCPSVCPDIIDILRTISINNGDRGYSSNDSSWLPAEFPVSAVPLFVTSSVNFQGAVRQMTSSANEVYNRFAKPMQDIGSGVEVCVLADAIGSLLVHSALTCDEDRLDSILCSSSTPSPLATERSMGRPDFEAALSVPTPRLSSHPRKSISLEGLSSVDNCRTSSLTRRKHSSRGLSAFNFHVSDLFVVGSPIGLTISKTLMQDKCAEIVRPLCTQVYNIFQPFDPVATRLEPIIDMGFKGVAPAKIPRYQTFPFSQKLLYDVGAASYFMTSFDGSTNDVSSPHSPSERICPNEEGTHSRKASNASELETRSDYGSLPWGSKRVDYTLPCPDGLQHFPKNILTQLCYNSYWESRDLMAFVLWQILDKRYRGVGSYASSEGKGCLPVMPKEKWQKRRTTLKIKNLYPNHRANDVLCGWSDTPTVAAKFVYGPVDVASLSGELVDMFVSRQGLEDWKLICTQLTDSNGRLKFKLPSEVMQGPGVYSTELVVRGDHSSVACTLAMLPSGVETVVFSIDGSFLSGYSIRGIDPKIRGGAVDAVRHWQELGYLIIYVTSRLLFQKVQVMSWLSQHNFPFGILSFCESISKDIQKHKLQFLRTITQSKATIHAAYGSPKDIHVYSSAGVPRQRMFILGKSKHKKQYPDVQVIDNGYSSHLTNLASSPLSRPAATTNGNVVPCWSFGRSRKSPKEGRKSLRK